MPRILITGAAGFIGSQLVCALMNENNIIANDFHANISTHVGRKRYDHIKSLINIIDCDITNFESVKKLLIDYRPDLILHLAAATGIAESMTTPKKYFDTNILGFYNIVENARLLGIKKIMYASSSSVYPPNTSSDFRENDATDSQLSFYGSSKKANEILATSYAQNFNINFIGLRFFTVYGSWVRQDMAGYKFMDAIQNKQPITLFNNGNVLRDFTHVSDIVNAMKLIVDKMLNDSNIYSNEIYNIGFGNPSSTKDYVNAISNCLGKEAIIVSEPLPKNELKRTHASTTKLESFIHYKPTISLQDGVLEMCNWYREFIK